MASKKGAIRDWLKAVGVRTLYIEPGSPWENGYVESFNRKLRDEPLKREVFETLKEAQVLIERWRQGFRCERAVNCLFYRLLRTERVLFPLGVSLILHRIAKVR